MAGKDFNPEGGLDIYKLLPLWWHVIKPEEKETVALTVHKHGSYIVRDSVLDSYEEQEF